MQEQARLASFPIAWFTVIMGLAGLSIAWNRAEMVWSLPFALSGLLRWLTVIVFALVAALYAAKLVRHPGEVTAEFYHPVKLNLFAAISIGLILLSIAFLHSALQASRYLWTLGAAVHLLFTLYVIGAWINQTHFQIHHINPTWFIPVVGNILVPIAGVQHANAEVSWFFFSIGLVFWLILATIVFYRVIFHEPMPSRLVPTMFILIAPPAVGFISYLAMTGSLDGFARVLYYSALFLTLLLLSQARRFLQLPFSLSWWAYSFPIAAVTIATLQFYQRTGVPFFAGLSVVLLGLLSVILSGLMARTLVAVFRREVCITEG